MSKKTPITKQPHEFKYVGTRVNRPDGVDKVLGKALFGADTSVADMLIGKVLRSPHPHARIRAIDTRKAEALPGVKAVITAKDIKPTDDSFADVATNVLAQTKALYDGHAVAAVAAIDEQIAKQALKLIKVDYQVLPHVTDVDEAMRESAPVLHDDMFTAGLAETPTKPSNISCFYEFGHGDVAKGFAEADVIIERSFKTEATHQGYIEPHACLARFINENQAELWCCTQGHFYVRDICANLMNMEMSKLRVTSSEIGGGFGGKTTVFIEPVALALSRKSGHPVKMSMNREEVFRASGPTSSTSNWVKIGVRSDGTITAGEACLKYQGGAFAGSPAQWGAMAAFAPYALENVRTTAYDVVCNRPKAAAYRAPGAPIGAFIVESLLDEIAEKLNMDKLDLRIKNAAKEGDKSAYGPIHKKHGLMQILKTAKEHPHYNAPLQEGHGRGIACGFWFNFGGQSCVNLNVTPDGTVNLAVGSPDIGGSRASMCLMAAEELGIPYEKIRAIIADTASLGYNDVTDGSRTTFSTGLATITAAKNAADEACKRAAKMWDIPPEAVTWRDGHAHPAGDNAGKFPPLSLAEIAAEAPRTGGPIAGHCEAVADGAGVSFGLHIADIKVDKETGKTELARYTAFQDAGKAIHPSYVEGQMQGGSAQGIGWALNEEYIYGEDGKLQNPGFLDYRIPVASDLPMIDTCIIETPNEGHPYGVRGVGETSIVPPLACIANAIHAATGKRLSHLPISPPKILEALLNS